jgi:hypothetical protein
MNLAWRKAKVEMLGHASIETALVCAALTLHQRMLFLRFVVVMLTKPEPESIVLVALVRPVRHVLFTQQHASSGGQS